jgi:putative toxin-antitoxin system antitoxin component (TIGR02293 family)
MAKPSAVGRGRTPTSADPKTVVWGELPGSMFDCVEAYHADPIERVRLVKHGVPAKLVEMMAKGMSIPKERLVAMLGLARATVDRKAREDKLLSVDESSRVLGMARLLGQVHAMVLESGDAARFDAAGWLAVWLERPLPALGGRRPAELMDTPEGQAIVFDVVARLQSGAYS